MKKRLLYLLIGFSFFEGFAQVANSADDIVICEVPYDGFATFDLTVNACTSYAIAGEIAQKNLKDTQTGQFYTNLLNCLATAFLRGTFPL